MTKEDAIKWYRNIECNRFSDINIVNVVRESGDEKYAGRQIREEVLQDEEFLFGVQYGIEIAIAKIFGVEMKDVEL